LKFKDTARWIFRSRDHNNDDGQSNQSNIFYGLEMWLIALDSPATSYPSVSYENKAYGGIIALATTVSDEPTTLSFAIYWIGTASTY